MPRTISSFEREILEFTTHQAQSKTKSERSGLREFSEKMYKGVTLDKRDKRGRMESLLFSFVETIYF